MTRPTRPNTPDHPDPPSGPRCGSGSGDLARWLCHRIPEFTPAYLALAEAAGDDPGDPVVLMALADMVSAGMTVLGHQRRLLERALGAIEDHLEAVGDDAAGCEVVAFAFFDTFPPEDRRTLAPGLGPRSRALSDGLDLPGTDWDATP